MKKSIKKNYIFNVSYQIINLLVPFIISPHISRILKADGIGEVSYIESVVSYFVLFATLGVTTYGQREISYVQDLLEKRTVIFWETKIIEVCSSAVAIVVYIFFLFRQENKSLYIIFIFSLLAVLVDITWFFQGIEEFGKVVAKNILIKIFNIIFVYCFIRTQDDLILYAFGLTFFLFMGNLSLWRYLGKFITRVKLSQLHPFRNIKIIISLFVPTIAIQIYTVLDKTMIGVITQDTFENGYYEFAIKICRMAITLVTALGAVMIPRIGYHFEKKEIEIVKSLMYKSYRFIWFLGIPLCFGLIIVSKNFIPWFLGAGYEKVIILLGILSFLILAIGISNVTGMQYLLPTKREKIFTAAVICGAIFNFILNLFLINVFQSIGAAIASVIAEIIVTSMQLYFVRREISCVRILKEGRHYFIAVIFMMLVLVMESFYLESSVVNTTIMVVSGASVYFIVLTILKDELWLSSVNSLLKLMRKRISY